MKRRLRHLALRAVLSALARDHARGAQQHFRTLHGAFFDEVLVLHHEHFANVVGMIQEDDVIPPDLVVGDIAIPLRQVLKQQNGIRGTKSAERKPEEIPLETGRKAVLHGPAHLIPGNAVPGCSCHFCQRLAASVFCSRSNSARTSPLCLSGSTLVYTFAILPLGSMRNVCRAANLTNPRLVSDP